MKLSAVLGDITTQRVDVIVNAANNALRGGGGVDGAIHRVGGPTVLADCIRRFPTGIATGDAGGTTAGDLPCRWVVHTVGPNHSAGQRDRSLLESCYRRALEVSEELGARSIAFPLISAGAYGWPRRDAIEAAIDTIARTPTTLEEVRLVTLDQATHEELSAVLARSTPLRILQGVRELHRRGRQGVRVLPGMSASGMFWRVEVRSAGNVDERRGQSPARAEAETISYSTGALTTFAGGEVDVTTTPDTVADLILAALPRLDVPVEDGAYAVWFDGLVELAERTGTLPIAYADYFNDSTGWEIGWGSGTRYPHPPGPPGNEGRR